MSYINSTGIALIVGLLGRARADGVPVSACGLTDHYREIFEITRLSDFMTIDDAGAGADAAVPEGSDVMTEATVSMTVRTPSDPHERDRHRG